MHNSAQIPKQAVHKLQRERAGLFLPDALCLKEKVLTDSWAPGPYSARVQCGCLANEVDYRDYNQTGNISVLMCQSGWENLPVLQCQSELLASDRFMFTIQQHRAVSQSPQGGFKTSQGRDSYWKKELWWEISPWVQFQGPGGHWGHSKTYKLSPVGQ